MKNFVVNIERFARIGQKNKAKCIWTYLYSGILSVSLLTLSGCVTSEKSVALAPNPPEHRFLQPETSASLDPSQIYDNSLETPVVHAAADAATSLTYAPPEAVAVSLSPEKIGGGCSIQDRFDRKALIAYEWDRSRLSMDVDGIGGGKLDEVRLEYKIRLQPEKPKKLKCRYPSKWQGLVGSGYNELVERKDDTVFEEVRELKKKANPYLERFF